MLVKSAAALVLLSAAVFADTSSYAAAGNSYAAPAASSGYSAPGGNSNYAAPAATSGYGAPSNNGYSAPVSSGYEAQAGYDVGTYDYGSYNAVEETGSGSGDGGILASLEEFIPLFLVVVAAILLASILGPLFAQLLMLIVGLLPMALNIKAPIINAILNPFNLGLCMINAGAAPTIVTGRSFDEWEMDTTYIRAFFDAYDLVMSNVQ